MNNIISLIKDRYPVDIKVLKDYIEADRLHKFWHDSKIFEVIYKDAKMILSAEGQIKMELLNLGTREKFFIASRYGGLYEDEVSYLIENDRDISNAINSHGGISLEEIVGNQFFVYLYIKGELICKTKDNNDFANEAIEDMAQSIVENYDYYRELLIKDALLSA